MTTANSIAGLLDLALIIGAIIAVSLLIIRKRSKS